VKDIGYKIRICIVPCDIDNIGTPENNLMRVLASFQQHGIIGVQ
jgi:hypothetical protein